MALVGLGYGTHIAKRYLKGNPFVELLCISDKNRDLANQISQEIGKPVQDFDSLLCDPEVEVVGLFTGPSGRADLIQKIIRAGKDVLTTKPFEINAEKAREVLKEAQDLGRIIHLNSPCPTPSGDLQQILDWQEEHQLGMPHSYFAKTWASYHEKADGTWYDNPKICGSGPLLRLGIYFFNEFAALPGVPESVYAIGSRLSTGRPTLDHAQVSIAYKNGAIGNVFASFCIDDGESYRDEVNYHYHKGTIRTWHERNNIEDGQHEMHAVLEMKLSGKKELFSRTLEPGDFTGWYQWHALHRAVRERILLDDSAIQKILFGVTLLNSVNQSIQKKSVVYLNQETTND